MERNKMQAVLQKRPNVQKESRKCAQRFWVVFPHFILTWRGGGGSNTDGEYREFLGQIVHIVQNDTGNSSSTHETILDRVQEKMKKFKSIWFQRPSRWSFFGSMFFCCTVFTTVGYGEIYPITLPGKVACVLYAMVGIPLMLLVILDVGDFLALVMSRAYVHIHSLFKALRSRSWSPWKRGGKAADSGRFVLSQDVVIREPLDLRQVLRSQADVRHKSVHLENNREIFEKILARENLKRKGPLLKSLSCPELDQLLPAPKGYAIWDFSGLGDGMETLDFPFILILLIVFAYICLGGLILPLWETEFEDFDPYYFCFITLTTIGFGDIVPRHPNYFMLTSLFIIVGMAIMSMAFKLSQTRIVGCYRKCIKFISRGNVETSKDEPDV
ncbi:unnamed protein product [Menidia menidia]|uniref:(Atlantic silverside) hypothetical protein n=1 Tax=Menidia menidia TaxID=238744 RepID=A0A8S4BRV5_9TELE|nr:unnamed protein product [Menidia menidia]